MTASQGRPCLVWTVSASLSFAAMSWPKIASGCRSLPRYRIRPLLAGRILSGLTCCLRVSMTWTGWACRTGLVLRQRLRGLRIELRGPLLQSSRERSVYRITCLDHCTRSSHPGSWPIWHRHQGPCRITWATHQFPQRSKLRRPSVGAAPSPRNSGPLKSSWYLLDILFSCDKMWKKYDVYGTARS